MPRIEVIRADKNSLKWVDDFQKPKLEGFRLFRGETLELRVDFIDTLLSDTDFTGKLFKLVVKDPAGLSGQFLASSTDISAAFTDLPLGKMGFTIIAVSTAIDTFIGESECEKVGIGEIIEVDGLGNELQIMAHDTCRVIPDANRGTEGTTTTTTTTT